MRTEKKELNVQIGKRLQTVRENSGYKEKAEDRYCIIDINKDDFIAIKNGANLLEIVSNKLLALQLDTDYKKYLSKHPAE